MASRFNLDRKARGESTSASSSSQLSSQPEILVGADGGIETDTVPSAVQSTTAPTIPERGGWSMGTRRCGLPEGAFNGSDVAVPPGSHYAPWVWNAMDKEGHITVELYVDGKRSLSDIRRDESGSAGKIRERYRLARAPVSNPEFSSSKHCLVSVPASNSFPWDMARRVLLIPQTFEEVALPVSRNFRGGFSSRRGKEPSPSSCMAPHPDGIKNWLDGNFDRNVIFGYCSVAGDLRDVGMDFWWVVISLEDLRRQHEIQHPSLRFRDPEEIRPRYMEYLGYWADAQSLKVLQAAHQGAGPVMPDDWSEEDVEFVANTHKRIKMRN